MKIALVAPLWEAVPPKTYGGTEYVVYLLAKYLARRSHHVTLYASEDSCLNLNASEQRFFELIPFGQNMRSRGITHFETGMYELPMIEQVIAHSNRYDIIHNHLGYQLLPFASMLHSPMVTTLHGAMVDTRIQEVHLRYRHLPFISISDFQRTPCPNLNYMDTIYHGLELDRFEANTTSFEKNYALFLGRLSPEKGVDHAIAIARDNNIQLIIAGKVDANDREYYETTLKPLIDGKNVVYIGEVNHEEKTGLLKNAYVTLCPVTWPEPFGLVLIEALACGSPVLALKNGSIPEVLKDGVTGFIRETQQALSESFKNLDQISRQSCRMHAEESFNVETMIDRHLALYRGLLQRTAEEDVSPQILTPSV